MKAATVILTIALLATCAFAWEVEDIVIDDIGVVPCNDLNCKECNDDNTTCIECKIGYFFTPDSKACETCRSQI